MRPVVKLTLALLLAAALAMGPARAADDAGAGYQKSRGFDIQAFNYKADASAQRATAKAATISTAFGVGSTALGAATQVNKFYMDQKAAKLPPVAH